MKTIEELYNSTTPNQLLWELLNSVKHLKFGQDRFVTTGEKVVVLKKISDLLGNKQCKILLRGMNKSKTKEKLISKLNSNDSLYDGLFLVGDKAKNFLEKSDDIPHPIKMISSIGKETAAWIFDSYKNLNKAPIDISYFKEQGNRNTFIKKVKENEELTDYYLFGLHTFESNSLVNFVSTTSSTKTAFFKEIKNKLVTYLWLPKSYNLYINYEKIQNLKNRVKAKKLPILSDSFHPEEEEFSFKGFILPHIIIGVHDLEINEFFLNPALLIDKENWQEDGLEIDQSNFKEFIKQSKYKRFLELTDRLVEKITA